VDTVIRLPRRIAAALFLSILTSPLLFAATFTITNTNDSGAGSLRQSILDANATAGTDTIAFSIATGPQLILVTSSLPAITDTATVDGTTQPGYAGTPLIGIDGSLFISSAPAIDLQAAGSQVIGLSITNFHSANPTNLAGAAGVSIEASSCTVKKCWLGLKRDGTVAGNDHGLDLRSSGATIGGSNPGDGNVISGGTPGVYASSASNTRIEGNNIHNNPDDSIYLSQSNGISITGNIIRDNRRTGVHVVSGTGNPISKNSIYGNNYGIVLGPILPLGNDFDDLDAGPNLGQNHPILTGATSALGTTTISGNINSTPNTTFHIEFFSNPACGPGGSQGQTYIGATDVTTSALAVATFSTSFNVTLTTGSVVTATATDPASNTSDFAFCATVEGAGLFTFNGAEKPASEHGGSVTLNVFRGVGGSAGTVTVDYATVSGTATAGADFTAVSGTLTFADGEISKFITIPILQDSIFEGPEQFTVVLSSPTGGAGLGSPATGVVTISDDDPPPVVSIGDASIVEGNSGKSNMTFVVTLSPAIGLPATVSYSTTQGTASWTDDFDYVSGSITFNAGETQKIITVPIIGDTKYEYDETLLVNLFDGSQKNCSIGRRTGTGTIINDDIAPTLSINDIAVVEGTSGQTPAVFTVTLSEPLVGALYAWADVQPGTAQFGTDFDGELFIPFFFPAGTTKATIALMVNGDTLVEPDETFTVTLLGADYGALPPPVIAKAVGKCTILNDDAGMAWLKLPAGTSGRMTIYLGNPAQATDAVALTSAKPDVAKVPASFVAQGGRTTLAFDVDALALGASLITAKLPASLGGTTLTANVEVYTTAKLAVEPSTLTVPVTTLGKLSVTMTPAPSTAVGLKLSTNTPAIIQVPSTVTIDTSGHGSIDVQGLAVGSGALTITLPNENGAFETNVGVIVASAPTGVFVTQVSPPAGPTTGGTPTTIAGMNFTPSCTVTFDGSAATDVSFVSPSALRATTPAHAADTVEVTVTCGDDRFTLANEFTYVLKPTRTRGVRH
jgi:parallel beta-helix repeat protein